MHREGKERKEREYKRDRSVHNEKKRKEKSRLEEGKRESNGKCIFMTKKLKEVEKWAPEGDGKYENEKEFVQKKKRRRKKKKRRQKASITKSGLNEWGEDNKEEAERKEEEKEFEEEFTSKYV